MDTKLQATEQNLAQSPEHDVGEELEPKPDTAAIEVAARKCEVCGNRYDKSFEVTVPSADGLPHIFDCFECAIEALAPRCGHCQCTIIGHGIEAGDHFYCCAHCARQSGDGEAVADRAR